MECVEAFGKLGILEYILLNAIKVLWTYRSTSSPRSFSMMEETV